MNNNDAKPGKAPADQECVNRRRFVGAAIGGAGVCYLAALGYPVYRYLSSPVEKATAMAAVKEVVLKDALKMAEGEAVMFKFGVRPALLIHHKDGSWVALDAVCTHLGCTVQFDRTKELITCACHGGVYNPKTGGNISGPPPKPLKPYVVKVTEAGVVVSRS